MAKSKGIGISQVRGAILEEVVLYLLEKVGYRTLTAGDEGTQPGVAGLEVRGRGEWHQIDSLAAFDHTPPFMYPLRLLVEAKCYAHTTSTIGIDVMRNSLGVITDISQNYFTLSSAANTIQVQRFNYQAAVFSTNGFSANAIRYAIAHQIFPIQYKDVPLMKPVADSILQMKKSHIVAQIGGKNVTTAAVRSKVRDIIREPGTTNEGVFTDDGFTLIQQIRDGLNNIRGSYFGMLQGRWPLHLLSAQPLPPEAFQHDRISCRVYVHRDGSCVFQPSEFTQDSAGWFSLQFSLPEGIVDLLTRQNWDPMQVAEVKREYFSTVSLSGIIGGVRRQVRLELDQDLLNAYLEKL